MVSFPLYNLISLLCFKINGFFTNKYICLSYITMYTSLLAPLALQNLKDKCLIKITMDGILNNHDQLQYLGQSAL
jgi:hypothetical protein